MSFAPDYLETEPALADVQGTSGLVLLEFGAPDCGICHASQPVIRRAVAAATDNASSLTHHKIHDGSGRPLGRAFGVKLWPTLVLLQNGQELGREVRPGNERVVAALLALGNNGG